MFDAFLAMLLEWIQFVLFDSIMAWLGGLV